MCVFWSLIHRKSGWTEFMVLEKFKIRSSPCCLFEWRHARGITKWQSESNEREASLFWGQLHFFYFGTVNCNVNLRSKLNATRINIRIFFSLGINKKDFWIYCWMFALFVSTAVAFLLVSIPHPANTCLTSLDRFLHLHIGWLIPALGSC